MNNLIIKNLYLLFFFGFLFISSCVDNNLTPPLTGDLNTTAEILVYLEHQSDFPNSYLAPALIDAEEVFANLNSYLLIDVRTNDEFLAGHIENSVNLSLDSLFNFVEKNINSGYQKIVIVSKNGQSSSYFTCLLRLAGFNNVFSMNFGMASWNAAFAEEWMNNLGNYVFIGGFTNDYIERNEFTSLPQISFSNPEDPVELRVNSRIKELIAIGFKQSDVFETEFSQSYQYIICYGSSYLYYARKLGVFDGLGHPLNARSYGDSPSFELRSVQYLQTLPNSTPILLYDYNGQLGACMTAYLRVLGYDVKMLLFGANQLFYSRMIDDPELIGYTFSPQKIKNYPYINGE